MKKSILNIEGARPLSKLEAKATIGGNNNCYDTWAACDEHSSTHRMFSLCMYYAGCGPAIPPDEE